MIGRERYTHRQKELQIVRERKDKSWIEKDSHTDREREAKRKRKTKRGNRQREGIPNKLYPHTH